MRYEHWISVITGAMIVTSCGESQRANSVDASTPISTSTTAPTPTTATTHEEETQRRTSSARTKVVMLGTGTPNPDPERSGPAVAVVAGGASYIVDFGAGVVRRAAAAYLAGIDPLAPEKLTRAFVTHLHSDHTLGYADLILTPWVMGREVPLQVYGPPGLEKMTTHILAAYEEDLQVRQQGNQPATSAGYKVEVHEIEPGLAYEDRNVKVTAFAARHGAWKKAYGYHFESSDRRIVISGDTTPTEATIEACQGCDVLVHEVYVHAGWEHRSSRWQAYHKASHTSSRELGELAARAEPKLLVLYHQLRWGAAKELALQDIRRNFEGEVVWANDLDQF